MLDDKMEEANQFKHVLLIDDQLFWPDQDERFFFFNDIFAITKKTSCYFSCFISKTYSSNDRKSLNLKGKHTRKLLKEGKIRKIPSMTSSPITLNTDSSDSSTPDTTPNTIPRTNLTNSNSPNINTTTAMSAAVMPSGKVNKNKILASSELACHSADDMPLFLVCSFKHFY